MVQANLSKYGAISQYHLCDQICYADVRLANYSKYSAISWYCDKLCSPPARDRGNARDCGKQHDLSFSYVAHDRGNTRDQA
jgi:hypothetical protein